ncbi:MAG: LAGLIDADG family homing endonuclease, partial [Candidatus Woesearchaeota archaeon]
RATSRPLVRLIRDRFREITTALESRIPELVLTSSNEVLAGYLRGFFDAEGYVRSNRIGLGINNEILSAQIQTALLRLGIVASRRSYDNRKNPYSSNTRWTIEISDQTSLRTFSNTIGFTACDKHELLEKISKCRTKSLSRRIAFEGRAVRSIIEAAGGRVSEYPRVSNFFNSERRMSIDTFERSIYSESSESVKRALEPILRFDYLPVRIATIERGTTERLIDISTTSESFIAQGLVVHNSAQRFARLREGAAKDHYKKVAEYVKEQFLNREGLKGIIVGGPGPTKYEFVDGNYITDQVKQKIIGIKDLSYTDEFGLQELVDKSQDLLAEEEIAAEKDMLNRFFTYLNTQPGMVAYGTADVKAKLEMGAVDTLVLSESTPDEVIEELSALAEQYGSTIMLTSPETREGHQLDQIGKVAAILRYEMQE